MFPYENSHNFWRPQDTGLIFEMKSPFDHKHFSQQLLGKVIGICLENVFHVFSRK